VARPTSSVLSPLRGLPATLRSLDFGFSGSHLGPHSDQPLKQWDNLRRNTSAFRACAQLEFGQQRECQMQRHYRNVRRIFKNMKRHLYTSVRGLDALLTVLKTFFSSKRCAVHLRSALKRGSQEPSSAVLLAIFVQSDQQPRSFGPRLGKLERHSSFCLADIGGLASDSIFPHTRSASVSLGLQPVAVKANRMSVTARIDPR
jgi:hypothetical protein